MHKNIHTGHAGISYRNDTYWDVHIFGCCFYLKKKEKEKKKYLLNISGLIGAK